MHYRWKDDRIVLKIAIWGAMEGDARDTLDRIGARLRALQADGEIEQPGDADAPGAVGVQRNGDVTRVEEEDRHMSLFMGHPPGEAGRFEGRAVDYKCLAPHAPVEGNRGFDSAMRGADGVFFVVDARQANLKFARAALRAMLTRLADQPDGPEAPDTPFDAAPSVWLESFFGAEVADTTRPMLTYVLRPEADGALSGDKLREALELPDSIPILADAPSAPNERALEAFLSLARRMKPILERAKARHRIPERD